MPQSINMSNHETVVGIACAKHAPMDPPSELGAQVTLEDIQYLREPQVLQLFPFSRSQLWALVKRGEFPAPVKLSERCSVWALRSLKAYAEKLRG